MKSIFSSKCKRISALMLVLVMLSAFMVPVSALEGTKLNYESADIYVLDEDYREVIGDIPSEYPEAVQLEVNTPSDSMYWYVSEGESVTVDQNGLVTPNTRTWYWYGNLAWDYPVEGMEPTSIEVSYITGESTVTCVCDGVSVSAVIDVVDYSNVYADKKIQEYVDANITDSMTDYEKLEKACQYAASFDYSVDYSGYKTMVIFGGGDCWASTSLITYMCNEFFGIDAAVRYAVNDPGAGSGHRNAVVCIDGKYYEAEAGFVGTAPRYYYIRELADGFSFKSCSDGYAMYQYDGTESDVVIPEAYNNTPVTEIGGAVFFYNGWDEFAPVSVTIPSAVKRIDLFAFSDIKSLQAFYVNEGNEAFCSEDGVIYTKDKKNVFAYPSGKEGVFTVPEGTERIGAYSVYYAKKLTEVIIPEGVTHIEEGAFGDCSALTAVSLPKSLQSIENFAFYNDPSLTEIYIPESVTEMGDYVFSNTDTLTIYCEDGSYAQEYAKNKNIKYVLKLSGDTETDGEVNIKDATAIQKYLAEIVAFSPMQKDVADFNSDGKITIADATAIQKMLAGLEY